MTYTKHNCSSAYKKNVQVPVCPLCNSPVPIQRGTLPDIAVGNHIDNDCKSDQAQGRKKVRYIYSDESTFWNLFVSSF